MWGYVDMHRTATVLGTISSAYIISSVPSSDDDLRGPHCLILQMRGREGNREREEG